MVDSQGGGRMRERVSELMRSDVVGRCEGNELVMQRREMRQSILNVCNSMWDSTLCKFMTQLAYVHFRRRRRRRRRRKAAKKNGE